MLYPVFLLVDAERIGTRSDKGRGPLARELWLRTDSTGLKEMKDSTFSDISYRSITFLEPQFRLLKPYRYVS